MTCLSDVYCFVLFFLYFVFVFILFISNCLRPVIISQHLLAALLQFHICFLLLESRSRYRVCINYRRILQNHFPPTLVYAFPTRWQ